MIWRRLFVCVVICSALVGNSFAQNAAKEEKRQEAVDKLQKEFSWWPTDAQPAPVKDEQRGGWWWWPQAPGAVKELWGNRGYCYVNKVIFDYKSDELPAPKKQEMRASLLIKSIIRNVKVYFDFNKSWVRKDAAKVLDEAVKTLEKYPDKDILITGNCDTRGSEKYNEKLGRKRAEAVKKFMIEAGISEKRIRIVSRGKLDAVAHVDDLVGMQKDRNAQFMIAEVEEVMIPYMGESPVSAASDQEIKLTGDGKIVQDIKEEVESEVKVSTKEYTVKKGDNLWKIAEKELGSGYRWKYLYELNKDKIKSPKSLKAGQKITIPVE